MRSTSKIARTDSVTFTRPTLPNQGRQQDYGGGYSAGRRIEMRRTTLMITNPRDHARGVQRRKDTLGVNRLCLLFGGSVLEAL